LTRLLQLALASSLLVLAGAAGARAQAPPAAQPAVVQEERPRSGWAALPIGTYSPDTSLGLGAFATHFFRFGDELATTRPSSLSLVALYTLKEQLIVELIPEAYWANEDWHIWGRVDYRRYPNQLWAQGNRATQESRETYAEDRVRWQMLIDGAVSGKLRIEGKLEAIGMRVSEIKPGGLLDTETLPGASGGRSIGVGGGVLWDSRDHMLTPSSGSLHELALMSFAPLIGSEYTFSTAVMDLRRYLPVTPGHVLALELLSELQLGTVPFFKLSTLGGEDRLRGLYEGRFRDKAMWVAQAEYRLPLFWRVSGVGHAGIGQVASSAAAFAFAAPEWSFGFGLRLLLNYDERLNLRIDSGLSREGYGIYVGIGEAF
jgi:hypothetical protein